MIAVVDTRRHEDIIHSALLERHARERPDAVCARFPDDGVEWTWSQARDAAVRAADHLGSLGVGRGDVVALFRPPGPAMVAYLLGALWQGSVIAPLNTAYRGDLLEHVLATCAPSAVVADAERAALLGAASANVITGDEPPATLTVRAGPADAPELTHLWDPYAVVFTSGTTGPSKGVLSPYGQIEATVRDNFAAQVRPDDVLLLDVPLFHVSGLLMLYTSLATGAELVVYPAFSASNYWARVRRFGVTVSTVVATEMLLATPPAPDDAEHPLRLILTGRQSPAWRARFGVERAFSFYNMSEISSPLQVAPDSRMDLGVGVPRPGVEVRIVDDHDIELPPGEIGELLVRTDRPWEMSLGYVNDAPSTAAAWRNGWFHTGDAFRLDPYTGEYVFVDRMKDCVRRRGENISSYEVERAAAASSMVRSCAVVAAPGDLAGDQEVLLVVVSDQPDGLDLAQLWSELDERLPSFMVPRYVRVVDELPVTETGKVRKVELRAIGVDHATVDRQQTT